VPIALVGGAVYVRASEWLDHRRFAQVGRSVDIGGRSLNIYCSGTGSPTVVFESGYGFPGYNWILVQPQVAKFTQACWYDRAGNGWSDPAPGPRFSDSVASDLHALLRAADVAGPHVLVGHSIGAFHVRVFNSFYPKDVAAIVLVDPSNEDVAARIPDMPRARPPSIPPAVVHAVDETLRQLGVWRLLTRDLGPRPAPVSASDWEVISSLRRSMKAQRAAAQEAPEAGSAAIARGAAGLDSVPLIVLTRGLRFPFPDTAYGNRLLTQWIALSGDLARRSVFGKQVVVAGSGHFVQLNRPGAVIAAIREQVERVRQAGRSPNHELELPRSGHSSKVAPSRPAK
jgi:pimeloyl-ACP methyl ester carboxylesterase